MAGVFGAVYRFFVRVFPRRQIHLRARGVVQFYDLSPGAQVGFAVLTIGFLAWVAYASVVVIFKEQIIFAKDQRYQSMSSYLESRISQGQMQYDELQAMVAMMEDRFQNLTREIEEKHRKLTNLLTQKQAMDRDMREVRRRVAVMEGFPGRVSIASTGNRDGTNTLAMSPVPVEPAVRLARGIDASTDSTIATITATMTPRKGRASNLGHNLRIKAIAALEDRLVKVKKGQVGLVREKLDEAQSDIERMEAMLGTTGVNVNEMVARLGTNERNSGRGGPLLPVSSRRGATADDVIDEFDRQFSRTALSLNRLDALTTTLSRIPLVTPVPNGQYRLTSGFGYRVDPFTGRGAFHSGTDLAGDYGTPILAAAPGKVIWADRRGPYGNMVEIDHGHGIRTRYAHLQSMSVALGETVKFRQKIATMGSTGRSTGPHLHYEIWFKDVVRDPMKFFQAGRYVFQG